MCVGFTFSFEHNFIQLQLSFLSGIVKHQISCRGLKPNFQHNTIIKLIISTVTFATILWNSPVFGDRFPPLFSNTLPSHSGNSSFHPSRVPWGQMLSHSHLNCSSQSLTDHQLFASCSVCLMISYLSGSSRLNHSITERSCGRPGSRVGREGEGTHRFFGLFGFQLKSVLDENILWWNNHLFCWYRWWVRLWESRTGPHHVEVWLSLNFQESILNLIWPMVTFWATNWTLTWIQIGYLHGMKVHTWCSFHQKLLHRHWGWLLVLSPIFPRKVEVTSSCL